MKYEPIQLSFSLKWETLLKKATMLQFRQSLGKITLSFYKVLKSRHILTFSATRMSLQITPVTPTQLLYGVVWYVVVLVVIRSAMVSSFGMVPMGNLPLLEQSRFWFLVDRASPVDLGWWSPRGCRPQQNQHRRALLPSRLPLGRGHRRTPNRRKLQQFQLVRVGKENPTVERKIDSLHPWRTEGGHPRGPPESSWRRHRTDDGAGT